jgi:hypothetical protein
MDSVSPDDCNEIAHEWKQNGRLLVTYILKAKSNKNGIQIVTTKFRIWYKICIERCRVIDLGRKSFMSVCFCNQNVPPVYPRPCCTFETIHGNFQS